MDEKIEEIIEEGVNYYTNLYYKKYNKFNIENLLLIFDLNNIIILDDSNEFDLVLVLANYIISNSQVFEDIQNSKYQDDVAYFFADKLLKRFKLIDELHKNFPQQEVQFQRIFKN